MIESSLDETLLLAVSKRKLGQLSEIRKTTIRQKKSLLFTAQETNSDGPYTTPTFVWESIDFRIATLPFRQHNVCATLDRQFLWRIGSEGVHKAQK